MLLLLQQHLPFQDCIRLHTRLCLDCQWCALNHASMRQVGLLVSAPLFAEASKHYPALRLMAVGLAAWILSTAGCAFTIGQFCQADAWPACAQPSLPVNRWSARAAVLDLSCCAVYKTSRACLRLQLWVSCIQVC